MSYSFKLKNGDVAIFDPENSILSITSSHGEVRQSTLGRAESRLLNLLLMEPGVTRTRDEIVDYTWNDRIVASGSLNQAVFSLRNALNDGREHEILMTVPRRGYRFNRNCLIDESVHQTTMPDEDEPNSPAAPEQPHVDSTADNLPPDALKKSDYPAKKLMIAYAATVILIAATLIQFGLSVETPKIQIVNFQSGDVKLHAVDEDLSDAQSLLDTLSNQLQQLPKQLKGDVWISQFQANYTVSCIRPDHSTVNLQFSKDQAMVEMVQQCLELPL